MAKSRPTIMKRQRELARQEKRRDKASRRATRPSSGSDTSAEHGEDYDPDIAHIVHGPQPVPWADEFPDEEEDDGKEPDGETGSGVPSP